MNPSYHSSTITEIMEKNPTNKKEMHKQLPTHKKTTALIKHHKDSNRKKRIQVIQQIKKTIEKFNIITKKSSFSRKSKYKQKQTHKKIETTESQRISYNLRPRRYSNINSYASSDESPISSFIPSRTSTQSEYPSISHNHTYNRTTSSCE